jgi:hypothetical protein
MGQKEGAGNSMNQQTEIQTTALLLQRSAEIIQNYDALYRKTGKKYNIFKIARISEKELFICRVIADLLNTRGSHCQGDGYLKLFWSIVSGKTENCPKLNTSNAVTTTEYSIEANRRIDIVIEDGSVFIPIEVKIWAGEQKNQIKDYAKYSQKKNGGEYVPVLYITLYGESSETAAGNEYISISFCEDILAWLEKCLKTDETANAPPIREIIKQLIEAVKSILGYSEDRDMDEAIMALILQSEETIRSAAKIENVLGAIDDEKWEIFKGVIFKKVQKQFPNASIWDGDDDWYAISVPVKNGAYTLYINYDWQSITVEAKDTEMPASIEKKINKAMIALTGVSDDQIDGVWRADNIVRYPGMETVEEGIYPYLLYKKYKQNPEEAANHIIAMANELEKI